MIILAVTLFFLGLGAYIYLNDPKRWWPIIFYIPMVLFLLGTELELLGRGKPAAFEIRQLWMKESNVISYYFEEDVAIYLWLLVEGEPRYYVLPWSMKQAQQLRGTSEERGGSGRATFKWPRYSTKSEDQEPTFYETPQAPNPLKSQ